MINWLNWFQKRECKNIIDMNGHGPDYTLEKAVETAQKYLGFEETDYVLDAGCGSGVVLKEIANRVHRITGIDYSSNMIAAAKQYMGQLEKLNLIVSDIYDLPFQDNIFDKIYAFEVIQYCEDGKKVIEELLRVCKKGGKILIGGIIDSRKPCDIADIYSFTPDELYPGTKKVYPSYYEPEYRFDMVITKK